MKKKREIRKLKSKVRTLEAANVNLLFRLERLEKALTGDNKAKTDIRVDVAVKAVEKGIEQELDAAMMAMPNSFEEALREPESTGDVFLTGLEAQAKLQEAAAADEIADPMENTDKIFADIQSSLDELADEEIIAQDQGDWMQRFQDGPENGAEHYTFDSYQGTFAEVLQRRIEGQKDGTYQGPLYTNEDLERHPLENGRYMAADVDANGSPVIDLDNPIIEGEES
jgi:hypothetical protein